MKLLVETTDYNETIKIAKSISQEYNKSVTFHCYWNGTLNEKHLYSILSFYHFNVYNNKHKIVLWLENNIPNIYNEEIKKYAEIKHFSLGNETKDNFLVNYKANFDSLPLAYYADYVRTVLLYNYGGCWFDLDCLCLRSFDPIFFNYTDNICVYQWENQSYPNNAIYISLLPKSEKMKKNIEFILNRNRGWGFQQANLTYDLPLDMLVLPCSWFNGDWIDNPYNLGWVAFFENTTKIYTFDNFFEGSFCYHWHNKWNKQIEPNSPFNQLINIIKKYEKSHS
jgi:hypothetical protein